VDFVMQPGSSWPSFELELNIGRLRKLRAEQMLAVDFWQVPQFALIREPVFCEGGIASVSCGTGVSGLSLCAT
jgi:hypothetical protein